MSEVQTPHRINRLLADKQQPILSVFFTAGFPDGEATVAIGRALVAAGVDMLEIGIPFSDPMADGPVIQHSNKVALQEGMSVGRLLQQVAELRSHVDVPILLMGYLNPVLQYGMERFCREAAEAGVDGFILPDLPMNEYLTHYRTLFQTYGLRAIFLVSPTTAEVRIRAIDSMSDAFLYAVSASSTTGARSQFDEEQMGYFQRLQALRLRNPFLVGFGISNPTTYRQATRYSAGVIIGSAFLQHVESKGYSNESVQSFIQSLTSPE